MRCGTDIQAAFLEGRRTQTERTHVTADRLDRELEGIAHSDPGDIFEFTGTDTVRMRPLHTISERARRAIASIKVRREVTGKGRAQQDWEILEVKWWDKLAAAEKLGRRFVQFRQKHEVAGTIRVEHLDFLSEALLAVLRRRLSPEDVSAALLEMEEVLEQIKVRVGASTTNAIAVTPAVE